MWEKSAKRHRLRPPSWSFSELEMGENAVAERLLEDGSVADREVAANRSEIADHPGAVSIVTVNLKD